MEDKTLDDLLYRWGYWVTSDAWRTARRELGRTFRSVMHSRGGDICGRYWQPCEPCWETGADLSMASGIKTRESLMRLAQRGHTCPKCKGRRGKWVTIELADPAAIPATGPGGMHVPIYDTPPEFAVLAAALDGLGRRYQAVVKARYAIYPKAKAIPGLTGPRQTGGEQARLHWVNQAIAPDRIGATNFGLILADARKRLSVIFGFEKKGPRK